MTWRMRARVAAGRRGLLSVGLVPLVLWGLWAAPASAQTGEVIEYYGVDAIGSIRVVFDVNGSVVARNDYVPFGESFTPTGPLPSEQFTGQVRDGEAGLDYFGARFYQPRHGRFSTVDLVFSSLTDPQQWNRYAYARNSPGTFVDPNGLTPILPPTQPPIRVGPCAGCSVTAPGTPGVAPFITGILMPGGEGPGTLGCPRYPDCLPDDTAFLLIDPQPEHDGGPGTTTTSDDPQGGGTGDQDPEPKVPGVVGWKTGEPELTIPKKQQERAGAVIVGTAAVGAAVLAPSVVSVVAARPIFLGPDTAFSRHGQGRAFGVILFKGGFGFHVDYHPLPSCGSLPIWHVNLILFKGAINVHVPLPRISPSRHP